MTFLKLQRFGDGDEPQTQTTTTYTTTQTMTTVTDTKLVDEEVFFYGLGKVMDHTKANYVPKNGIALVTKADVDTWFDNYDAAQTVSGGGE